MVMGTDIMEEGTTMAIGGHTLIITPIRDMATAVTTMMDITVPVQTEPDALIEEEMIPTDRHRRMIVALLLQADSHGARLHGVATE